MKPHPDAINMDALALPGVDIVHNAFHMPYPFEDGSFSEIRSEHFFEHIPHYHPATGERSTFLVIMEEMYRLLEPGGLLKISVPHHRRWRENLRDPTHTRIIHPQVWEYFNPDDAFVPTYYSHARFRLVRMSYTDFRAGPWGSWVSYKFPFMTKLVCKPSETTYTLQKPEERA